MLLSQIELLVFPGLVLALVGVRGVVGTPSVITLLVVSLRLAREASVAVDVIGGRLSARLAASLLRAGVLSLVGAKLPTARIAAVTVSIGMTHFCSILDVL